MTDFFFISSPLHLCLAANIALQSEARQRIALIMSKDEGTVATYVTALRRHPEVFQEVVPLSFRLDGSGELSRTDKRRLLRNLFSQPGQMRLLTGNDRRFEFQYAMHVATRNNAPVEGVYLDDGAVTYVGHKSMNSFQHRYIDPLFKTLSRGRWWKNSLTTGASDWIDSAYVAFPEAVHPLLRQKRLLPIDADGFKSETFVALASELIADSETLRDNLTGIKLVITLPHEAGFREKIDLYRHVDEAVGLCFRRDEVAVKPHPRTRELDAVRTCFPGAVLLDSRIGMEFLLPLLRDDALLMGDISTALLTGKWLRPDLSVIALEVFGELPEPLLQLYDRLQIVRTDPGRLVDRLCQLAGNPSGDAQETL